MNSLDTSGGVLYIGHTFASGRFFRVSKREFFEISVKGKPVGRRKLNVESLTNGCGLVSYTPQFAVGKIYRNESALRKRMTSPASVIG